MAKIPYGKWGCWIPRVGVLLSLFALITAQEPFLVQETPHESVITECFRFVYCFRIFI